MDKLDAIMGSFNLDGEGVQSGGRIDQVSESIVEILASSSKRDVTFIQGCIRLQK